MPPVSRRTLLLLLFLPLAGGPAGLRADPAPGPGTAGLGSAELVVLVHGMGRTTLSMLPLQLALERRGYRVLNFGYNSHGLGVAEIAAELGRRIETETRERPAPRLHFVGHSLGNIVVRWLLAHDPPAGPAGRFVMLAPPNRGARVADRIAPYAGWLLTPLPELRTGAGAAVRLPPPSGVEFAIIAGSWDGKVSVAETCLPGAKAYVVVPSGHTFIPMRPAVVQMVERFLSEGVLPHRGTERVSPCG